MNEVVTMLLAARASLDDAQQQLRVATNLLVNTGQTTSLISPVENTRSMAEGLHDLVEQTLLNRLSELLEVPA